MFQTLTCCNLLKPRSEKHQPKFGKNWPEIKMLNLSLETMKDNHCYHDVSHQIRNSYVVSEKNTCYLLKYINSRFGTIWFCVAILFLLWCLFWHVEMFFCIMFDFFLTSKLQKIRSIRIIDTVIANKKPSSQKIEMVNFLK